MSKGKIIDPTAGRNDIAPGDFCPVISTLAAGQAQMMPGGPAQTVAVTLQTACIREKCRWWIDEAQDCSVRVGARFGLGIYGILVEQARAAGLDPERAIRDAEGSLKQATDAALRAAGEGGDGG